MPHQRDPHFYATRVGREQHWVVEVDWPGGARTQVRHFKTEQEALDWIAHHARTWLHAGWPREPDIAPEPDRTDDVAGA